jgi:hypothetical protein
MSCTNPKLRKDWGAKWVSRSWWRNPWFGCLLTRVSSAQIEENSRALQYLAQWDSSSSLDSAGTSSSKDKWKLGARKTLLHWVSNALPGDSGIEIKDFGASWRDGIAFLAIIDAIKKNLVNIAELKKASNKTRLQTAFDVAETELGITRLLDPEDVDVPKPDERSIMTYVAQFLHKYPEPKSTGPDAIAAIQEEYGELLAWLMKKTQYLEHLQQTNSLPLSYSDYLAFKGEVDDKEKTFAKLKHLIEGQGLIFYHQRVLVRHRQALEQAPEPAALLALAAGLSPTWRLQVRGGVVGQSREAGLLRRDTHDYERRDCFYY